MNSSTATAGLSQWADQLQVSVASLERIGALSVGNELHVPERDAAGDIIGTSRRLPDGKKLMAAGSRRGLTMEVPLHDLRGKAPSDPILIVEGASDTAAGLDLGFATIGRPSATGGGDLLREVLADRYVVIVGENDATAGKLGANKIAAALHQHVAMLKVIFPPVDVKDLRAWKNAPAGCNHDEVLARIRAAEPWILPILESPASLTDVGNAERIVRKHGEAMRYCYPFGSWFIWKTRRFVRDDAGEAMGLAKSTMLDLFEEARQAGGNENIAKHAITSQRRNQIAAALDLAKPDLAVMPDDLDADAWALNVMNGIIDLRTGELGPHDPTALMTKVAPVAWMPDAQAPRWDDFLAEIFDGDHELIGYLQRLHGYMLTGDTSVQVMPVYYGGGANGKSTMLEAIARVMGDYADAAPPDLLLQRHGDEHPCEVADLMGKRMVVASESERNRRMKIQQMKRLTGDEMLKARFMRQDYFTFRRTFKMVLVTNNKPRVDEDTEAVWRRLQLIPFSVTIPADNRDPGLADKLRAESSGILRWLVDGCISWQRYGLGEPPAAVKAATQGYRSDSDPLRDFLTDCCTIAPDNWVSSADLRGAYERYAEAQGDHPISGRDFRDAIKRHGAVSDRRFVGWGWRGIGLLHVAEGE